MVFALGLDENGLGPRLGPLVVTAVAAEVREGASGLVGDLAARLGDSKRLVAHGDVRLGEAWARVLASLARDGEERVGTPAELFGELALDSPAWLRELCPEGHAEQCWGESDEAFEAPVELVAQVRRDARAMADAGVRLVGARVAVVCVKRLNEAQRAGVSRLHADLHSMERLVLSWAGAEREVRAVCGKVGGLKMYGPAFGPLGGRLRVALEETPSRSRYAFPGLGELTFLEDAEDRDPLVGLASLVGKWVRELAMGRISRFHGSARPVSGYHDPRTAAFVEATALTRAERGIEADCFERARAVRRQPA
jgi:ribonuclease HII